MSPPALLFAAPGDLAQVSGGYAYDRRLLDELRGLGWSLETLALPCRYPRPTATDEATACAALARIADDRLVMIDGLAFGAMAAIAHAEARRLRLVALVHHPLGFETGLSSEDAAAFVKSERRALAQARLVITTSDTTARTLIEDFHVPRDRVIAAPPGTEPAKASVGSGRSAPQLLAVGAVIPRKNYPLLVRALAPLRELPWHLTIAGSHERSIASLRELHETILAEGLSDRVELLGEVADRELQRLYHRSDLFVSASSYEGYGMAVADALARGVPVVAASGGALGEWLPRGAVSLVPVNDELRLSGALREVLSDRGRLAALREGASRVRGRLPTWATTAATVDGALQRVAAA